MKTISIMWAIVFFMLFAPFGALFAQPEALHKTTPITIGESYLIQSAALSEERQLNIYLPPGYNNSDTGKYPVVYLLDGGLDEDFVHVVGLMQFSSFPWVARVPPSIVVGICNVDRKRDFTFPTSVKADKEQYPTTGGAAKFIAFIEKELQPCVNRTFRTSGQNTIIGESLGGLLAAQILFSKPYLFQKYIIISPSLWWDNGSLLKKTIDDKQIYSKTDIYIGTGKEGLAPSEEPHVMEVDANMLAEKIENLHNKYVSIYLDYLPGENHATVAHQAIYNAIRNIFSLH